MARKATAKNIKLHICNCNDGIDSVEDLIVAISFRKLKKLGAKRRIYNNTKEVFYLIESDSEIIL